MERELIVPDVPKEILFYLSELIGEELIEDARSKYENFPNFAGGMNVRKQITGIWRIEYRVKFSVFDYIFSWEFKDSKKGIIVRFVGKTPGRWWEWMFDMDTKLADLFDDQWSAFCNFSIGYLTALAYEKTGKRKNMARRHVRAASKKLAGARKRPARNP